MSEYLYGQEGLQQECDAEGRGAEVTFFEYLHSSSRRSIAIFLLSGFTLNQN
jgi:hypothetical protein